MCLLAAALFQALPASEAKAEMSETAQSEISCRMVDADIHLQNWKDLHLNAGDRIPLRSLELQSMIEGRAPEAADAELPANPEHFAKWVSNQSQRPDLLRSVGITDPQRATAPAACRTGSSDYGR